MKKHWLQKNALKLKQRSPLLFGTAALTVGVTMLALVFIPPRYEASAFLQIRGNNLAAVTNEVEVLRSRELARAVIESNNLLELPEYQSPTPFNDVPEIRSEAAHDLPKGDDGFKSLEVSENVITSRAFDLMYPTLKYAVDRMLERLEVSAIPNSLIVNLTYHSADAKTASFVANALAETYLAQSGVATAQSQLAPAERTEMQARLNEIRAWLKDPNSEAPSPELLAAPLIVELKKLETVLTGRLAEQSLRYGNRHPFIQQTQTELKDVQQKILKEMQQLARSLERDLQSAASRQRLATPAEAVINNGSNPRIISYAVTPEKPDYPNRTCFLICGIIGGLLLGAFVTILATLFDKRITDSDGLEDLTGLACYASLPDIRDTNITDDNLASYILRRPTSAIAEAIRNLQLGISLRAKSKVDGEKPKIVAITSTHTGEGKTTLACWLARATAKAGETVLLIDGDMRNPSVHKALDIKNEHTLIDFLTGAAKLEEIIQKDEPTGLHVMAARSVPNSALDLLNSDRMEKLLTSLRQTYDLVIIDTPACHALADARYAANHADFTLFVVQANHTSGKDVEETVRMLAEHRITAMATVLNRAQLRTNSHQYGDMDEPEIQAA